MMKCPKCAAANEGAARFCAQCGARLSSRCPACQGNFELGRPFCAECGASLLGAAQQPIGRPEERKQVTVLFADMRGSLEIIDGRDPEDAKRILDPVLTLMMDAVRRFEGTVNQVMGDGVMALFGAPIAHEDHALRACYAALEMQDSVRRFAVTARAVHHAEIQIRVGINSGEVVVRSIANDQTLDYTAIGQTTHLASRMEQLAQPGTILLTGVTRALAEGHVDVVSLGSIALKGQPKAVETFQLVGKRPARSRLLSRSTQRLTRLVGRELELESIRQVLELAAAGRGQVLAVIGEPGIGKSRLIYEMAVSQATRGWLMLEACGFSYTKDTAYLPIIEILKTYCRIEHAEDLRRTSEKVRRTVMQLSEQLEPIIPALLALLGVPIEDPAWDALGAAGRRRRILDAIAVLLSYESRKQPVCLVIEDLQWIDFESQAVLDELAQRIGDARFLLLVSYRTGHTHGWSDSSGYSQIELLALSAEKADELLGSLVGPHESLLPLRRRLVEKTAGNPFFLEECVRSIVESDALDGEREAYRLARPFQTDRVPATVHALLAARIDRLLPEDKALAEMAAVIGPIVPLKLLEAATGTSPERLRAALRRLDAAQLLYETGQPPAIEYAFRHALIHDVAYGTLTHVKRRDLHARILEAVEVLAGDRQIDYVEQLAHHARIGEVWARATDYLYQAGTKAFERSANREAVTWFEQALEALRHLPETAPTLTRAVDLHLGLRNSLTLLGEHDRTLGHLREAQTLAERVGDPFRIGRVLSFQVNVLALLGQHDAAIEVGHRARNVSAALEDLPLRIATDQYVGRAHLYLGDFFEAIGLFEGIVRALNGARERDHVGLPVLPSVFARSHLIEALAEVGRFAESERYCDQTRAIVATTKHTDTLWWAHHARGLHHLAKREIEPAVEAHKQAHDLARLHDMPVYRARSAAELARAWSLGGHTAEALPLAASAMAEMTSRTQTTTYSIVLLLLGSVSLNAGEHVHAAEHVTRALGLFRKRRERAHEGNALCMLGDIAATRERPDLSAAETHYRRASSLAEELGMRPLAARCMLKIGLLLRASGQPDKAVQALRAARDGFRELELGPELSQSEAELTAAT
jgi:class 3 adenylate cyclase/tetratricopeptide (TPR) repeat protein